MAAAAPNQSDLLAELPGGEDQGGQTPSSATDAEAQAQTNPKPAPTVFIGMTATTSSALAQELDRQSQIPLTAWSLGSSLLAIPGVKRELVYATLCNALRAVVSICSPLLLYALLLWCRDEDRARIDNWEGWALAILNTLCIVAQSFAHRAYSVHGAIAGRWSGGAMSGAMFGRLLQLGTAQVSEYQTGELVNYFDTDCQNIAQLWSSAIALTLQPFEILAIVGLLWLIVKEATLVALFVFVVSYVWSQVSGRGADKYTTKKSQCSDERVKLLSEVLYGIKVVKANGWTDRFKASLSKIAHKESWNMLLKKCWLSQVLVMSIEIVDIMAFLVCIAAVLIFGQAPEAANLFTMWIFMGVLHAKLFAFPEAFRKLSMAWHSLKRCARFLAPGCGTLSNIRAEAPSVEASGNNNNNTNTNAVNNVNVSSSNANNSDASDSDEGDRRHMTLTDASFSYFPIAAKASHEKEDGNKAVLHDLNLTLKEKGFYAVVGPVGSGKSSLLLGIMGEMYSPPTSSVRWGNSMKNVAYVPQDPVVFNETVRSNILFGRPFEEQWYHQVCRACALSNDIENWSMGDLTMIGSKGINISGGQQSRICLARAVYARPDVLLLDDPLAKLDGRVSMQVLSDALMGLAKNSTRIIVTNSGMVAKRTDAILSVHEGQVHFEENAELPADKANNDDEEGEGVVDNVAPAAHNALPDEDEDAAQDLLALTGLSGEKSRTALETVCFFCRHFAIGLGSYKCVTFYLVVVAIQIAFIEWSVWALGLWTDDIDEVHHTYEWYAAMYGVGIGMEILLAQVKYYWNSVMSQRAWDRLHRDLLSRVAAAPLMWLQGVPVGHLLQLFAGSLDRTEDQVMICSEMVVLNGIFLIFAVTVFIVFFPPWAVVAALLALLAAYLLSNLGHASADARPEASKLRRQTLGHLAETLNGLSVVRSFEGAPKRQLQRLEDLLDRRSSAESIIEAEDIKLTCDLSVVGGLGYASAGFTIVMNTVIVGLSSGEIGYLLTNAIFFSLVVTEAIKNIIALMDVAREREVILRLVESIPQEQQAPEGPESHLLRAALTPSASVGGGGRPAWPSEGKVVLENLEVRYKPDLPLALRGISLQVNGGDHLGLVGRTGSGKSSLLLSICRLVEPCGGKIIIDGIDVTKIGLQELRSHLGVLSQDPLFFSGTVRENLDPFGEHKDDALWSSLEGVGIAAHFRSDKAEGLMSKVAELGGNLSVGQRQLLCLARAALREPRVVLVDEATAALDMKADARVQQVLEERFTSRGSTIVQVAHRLWSISRCNQVAVLEQGTLAELGSPFELLAAPANEGRRFKDMVASMGEKASADFRTFVEAHHHAAHQHQSSDVTL